MMKKIRDFFFKDIGWKLLSVAAAIVMWLVAMNIENPVQSKQISKTITLQYTDAVTKNNFVIVSPQQYDNKKILITLQGKRSDISKLADESALVSAYVDFRSAYYDNVANNTISLPINVDIPTGLFTLLDKNPKVFDVTLDRLLTKRFKIDLARIGEVSEGYVAQSPTSSPDSILITGAESDLDRIASVQVKVSYKDATSEIITNTQPSILDQNGTDISSLFALDTQTVRVNVPIKRILEVKLAARVSGIPAEGYTLSDIVIEPKTMKIIGDSEELKLFPATLYLEPPISINNVNTTKSQTYDLNEYLKSTNHSLYDPGMSTATVTANIERELIKEIRLPVSKIIIIKDPEHESVEILQNAIELTIKGKMREVENLNENNIKATLDLTGYAAGETAGILKFELPTGVVVVDEPVSLSVSVKSKEETVDENETVEVDATITEEE